jgi:hypothetical protein
VPLRLATLGLALTMMASCTSQPPSVTVFVSHQDGRPFANALVTVDAPEQYGRHPTNSAGVVRFLRIPEGEWGVEVHCPSANFIGKQISYRPVLVTTTADNIHRTVVPTDFCDEPPYSERTVRLRGYYHAGFEFSAFEPCGAEALNLSKNTFSGSNYIWVELHDSVRPTLEDDTIYFVEVEGVLKGPGSYGHMGGGDYQLTITGVTNPRKVPTQDCRRDLRDAA